MNRCSNKSFTSQNRALLSTIGRGAAEFLTLSMLCGLVVITLMAIINFSDDPITESSPVEYIEQLLLSLNVVFFLMVAANHPSHRRFALLIAGFFSCMLIRELDSFFDEIFHGFWKYPAILLAAITVFYASRSPTETIRGLAYYVQTPYFGIVATGMALLIVFSRLFGMGAFWEMVMDENYQRIVKNLVEEGTEMMAYTIITYGNFMIYRCMQSEEKSSQAFAQQDI